MIKYKFVTQASFASINFSCLGDDAATVLKINLSRPPFSVDYQGLVPNFDVDAGPDTVATGVAAPDPSRGGDIVLTITFSPPPDSSDLTSLAITPVYDSL